jgi:hypothetical protein
MTDMLPQLSTALAVISSLGGIAWRGYTMLTKLIQTQISDLRGDVASVKKDVADLHAAVPGMISTAIKAHEVDEIKRLHAEIVPMRERVAALEGLPNKKKRG